MREDAELPGLAPHPTTPRSLSLLIWLTIFGIALFIVGVVLLNEFRRIFPHTVFVRPPDRIFILLVLGTGGGLFAFGYGFVLMQRKLLVETIPTSTIRSLALGLVEVTGAVDMTGAPLTAPFSDLPCVFYSYKVEEQRGLGSRRQWETVAEGRSTDPFHVRDATGVIPVFPDGADLVLQDTRSYQNNWLGQLPANVTRGLARLGISTTGWFGSPTFRCQESCLLPGASVYMLGTAQASAGEPGTPPRLFIGRGQDRQFIISDRTQKELLARWGRQAQALLYGGPTVTVGCLVAIVKWYLHTG